MGNREVIEPRNYIEWKPILFIRSQAVMCSYKARLHRFHRGLRAWRVHKGLFAYLGGLAGSAKKKAVRAIEVVMKWREPDGLSEVGLPHSSDETCESRWSEGGSK